ncbi:HAD family hydrolase [Faecalibaculum rodentium]|uniref:HAD family hydrolase n=1 Tax=Faecalibaculum rodentium TaxID=1702221 RepID=UPI00255AC7AE|nr:HAD family hydrolase [Faecalibaculum rodentium]
MLKAIIMDMDGTLLAPGDHILPETKQKLLELERQGVTLILASGRSYTRLLPYADQLDMAANGGYLIEVDGISLYDMGAGEREVLRRMDPSEIREVYTDLMHLNCEAQACFDDGFFDYFDEDIRRKKEQLRKERNLPDDFPWTAGPWDWLADLRSGYPNQTFVHSAEEINRPINKIQLMQDEDKIREIYDFLIRKYGDRFEIFRTCPRQLEILPKGYSKGKTLKRLMEMKGWNKDEVVAFGDGENDVSMFEVVDDSFAMANARDFVKAEARYETASNADNGIVQGLERLGV